MIGSTLPVVVTIDRRYFNSLQFNDQQFKYEKMGIQQAVDSTPFLIERLI